MMTAVSYPGKEAGRVEKERMEEKVKMGRRELGRERAKKKINKVWQKKCKELYFPRRLYFCVCLWLLLSCSFIRARHYSFNLEFPVVICCHNERLSSWSPGMMKGAEKGEEEIQGRG